MTKKTHATEDDTPRPVAHAGHVHEGGHAKAVHVDELAEDHPKRKGKHSTPFRFENDKAFAIGADGKEVEVEINNAREAAHACMEADDATVRKVAADVARLYPVA